MAATPATSPRLVNRCIIDSFGWVNRREKRSTGSRTRNPSDGASGDVVTTCYNLLGHHDGWFDQIGNLW